MLASEVLALCEEAPQLITTEVYGMAYTVSGTDVTLSHGVLVPENANWDTLKPLCGSAKNIVDDEYVWTHKPPTCPRCLPKWNKIKAEHPEYMDWKEK
jgi:hypothetical protein